MISIMLLIDVRRMCDPNIYDITFETSHEYICIYIFFFC